MLCVNQRTGLDVRINVRSTQLLTVPQCGRLYLLEESYVPGEVSDLLGAR
jgi:hypothetical protein